jgi:DNA-binding NtrC family response regulator
MTASASALSLASVAQAADGVAADLLVGHAGGRARLPIADHLTRAGFGLSVAGDIAEALPLVANGGIRLCLLDLTQDRAALTTVRLIRARHAHVALAGVVDVTNPVIAAEALNAGVTDLLPWPVEPDELAVLLAHARERSTADEPSSAAPHGLFAESPPMRQLLSEFAVVAASHQHVCLVGEVSTGRTLIARTLHGLSGRDAERFVALDCSSDPADLERRLFGTVAERERGQGSVDRVERDSALARANGGTLFVSHLAEAPARLQARLARVLRDREATGDGTSVFALDVRVMLAVEPDVETLVADGRLHADLVSRVSQVRLDVPPLRRRSQDIPLLVSYFARQVAEAQKTAPRRFSRAALALLSALPWHGNAVELLSTVDVLTRSVARRVVQIEDVLAHAALDGGTTRIDTTGSLREARARFERECISAMLMRHHGRVGDAAKALGIQRTNLYRKVRQLNVSRALLSSRR